MNNKILSVVLVVGVAATGFAGLSSASETWTGFLKGNSEIRELMEKSKSGETLTELEQTTLDTAKAEREENGSHKGGKRKGGADLTDEEKATLETMSDEEKTAFFTVKKQAMNEVKETHKLVIAKLIAGEELSEDEELARVEILERLSGDKASQKEGTDIIKALVSGEALTAEQTAELIEMQAKKEEREAQKAILEPIKAKLEAGEELSEDEQALLDAAKAEREANGEGKGSKEGKGKKGEKGHSKGDKENTEEK